MFPTFNLNLNDYIWGTNDYMGNKYGEHRDNLLLLQASLLEEPIQGGRTVLEALHGSQDM